MTRAAADRVLLESNQSDDKRSMEYQEYQYERLPLTFNAADYFVGGNIRAGRGEKVAFLYNSHTLTYSEVFEGTKRAASFILQNDVDREERVALLLPDSPNLLLAFWGAIWAGCVPVPLNIMSAPEDLRYAIVDSRARLLITTTQLFHAIGSPKTRCILVDEEPSFATLLGSTSPMQEPSDTHRDEPGFWLYTSGTTGKPKGVIHAHHHMVTCAENYGRAVVGLSQDDICYSVAKIPFAYGLGNTLYMPMSVGATAVLSSATNVFDVIADVARYRPTVFWGIPFFYAGILAVQEIAPLDTSSLRLCVSAAEQLPPILWENFRHRYGQEICEGMGTTEFLHIFLSNRYGECRPGTSGRPVPGYDVRVVDASGKDVKPGTVGNLLVSGESLMLSYWNRSPETRRALCGVTMKTGDLYTVDVDGYFRFMGRDDDGIKINGMWVSPLEIESVLLEHPAVIASAVILAANCKSVLPRLEAYVVLRSDVAESSAIARQIRSLAKSRLAHFKAPGQIHFVRHLPRTPTGKLARNVLAKEGVEACRESSGGERAESCRPRGEDWSHV